MFVCVSQTVASKLHNTEVEVEILQTKEECDHVQFLITEKNTTGQRQSDQTAEVETLSQGHHQKFFFSFTKSQEYVKKNKIVYSVEIGLICKSYYIIVFWVLTEFKKIHIPNSFFFYIRFKSLKVRYY